jgi:fibronectin-binding autotransporter adhesin
LHSSGTTVIKSLEAGDTFNLSGGSLALTDITMVSEFHTFTMTSGTLRGAGTLMVDGTLNWNGGEMHDAGTTAVSSTGTLNIDGGVNSLSLGATRRISNAGQMFWRGTNYLYAYADTVIANSGTFTINNTTLLSDQSSTGTDPRIDNSGTITRTTTGTAGLAANVNNDGTMTTTAGTIDLQRGGTSSGTFGAGIRFSAGTHELRGATLRDGAELAGGTVNATGTTATVVPSGTTAKLAGATLGGSGPVTVNGTLTWTSGAMAEAGTTTVGAAGTLSIEGTNSVSLYGNRTIANAGTLSWASTNYIYAYANTVIANSGTFTIANSTLLSDQSSSGTDPHIYNTGTVTKTTAGTVSLDATVDNDGTLGASAGRIQLSRGGGGTTSTGSFDDASFTNGTFLLDGASLRSGVEIPAGVVNVTGTTTIPIDNSVTLNGGTVGGTGTLSVAGTLSWTSGAMSDAGATAITSSGTLAMPGSGALSFNPGRVVSNAGTIAWSGSGPLYGYSGSVITNSGTFAITGAATMSDNTGTTFFPKPFLHNTGTVSKSGSTAATSINWIVDNDGLMTSSAGPLQLRAGDAAVANHAGTYANNVEFPTGSWNLPGATFGSGARLTGATFALTATTTVGNGGSLTMTSGTLRGAGTLMVDGTLNWNGGEMHDAGTTAVSSTGTLNIDGGVNSLSLGATRRISNAGQMFWRGTNYLYAYADTVIANSGTFTINNTTLLSDQSSTGTDPRIDNSGTITRTTTGTAGLAANVNNDGTMTTTAGTIDLQRGGTSSGTFGAGIRFSAGTHELRGATLRDGAELAGGTVNATGTTATVVPSGTTAKLAGATLGGSGPVTVNGTLTWTSGAMAEAGTTTVGAAGTLSIEGTNSVSLYGNRTIANAGTLSWASTNYIYAYANTVIANSGTFTIANSTLLSDQSSSGTDPHIYNTGTVTKTTAGTVSLDATVDNDGTLGASAGRIQLSRGGGGTTSTGSFDDASFTNGTFLLDGASLRSGVEIPAGVVNVTGTTTIPIDNSVTLNGGTVGGTGTLSVAGTLSWTSGAMSDAGATAITSSGTLAMPGSGALSFNPGRVVSNAGTIAWSGSGPLYGYSGSVITNSGTFAITGAATMSDNSSTSTPDPLLHNTGTITKTMSTSATNFYWTVENDGVMTSRAGSLSLQNGGGTGLSTGSFEGVGFNGGIFDLYGATLRERITIPATVRIHSDTLVAAGGDVVLSGTLAGSGNLVVDGTAHWSGGTMQDAGTTRVSSTGTLNITGAGTKNLQASRVLRNLGTINWTGTGTVNAYSGSRMDNLGTLSLASDATLSNQAGSGTRPFVHNAGTIEKTAGTWTSTLQVGLDNRGTLRAASGTLSIDGPLANYSSSRKSLALGDYVAHNATLRIANVDVATLQANVTLHGSGASFVDHSGLGALRSLSRHSSGTLTVRDGATLSIPGSLSASAQVSIGASSTLTTAGSYSQSAGVTTLDGSTSKLAASGGVRLDSGRLTGNGTIQGDLTNAAKVTPGGAGQATLTVTGAYVQHPAGILEIDLGPLAGATDVVAVAGTASLDGTLRLLPDPGYAPTVEDRFTFLGHSSKSGRFSSVEGASLDAVSMLKVEHDSAATAAVVRAATDADWGEVAIDSGAELTNSLEVTLSFVVPEEKGVTGVRVANDADPTGAFLPYSDSMSWTLAGGDGTRRVHVQFRDSAGNLSSPRNDSIILDTTAPVATIVPPGSRSGSVTVTFDETVVNATATNVVLRVGTTTVDLAAALECFDATDAAVSCATDPFVKVVLTPTVELLPLTDYRAIVNPGGVVDALRDVAGNAAATTEAVFSFSAPL